MNENILIIILTISLVITSVFIGYNLKDIKITSEVKYNNSNCTGLSLLDSSKCLKNELSKFYNFNTSNTGKELTLDELKIQGGVCTHYARYYYDNMKQLGFNVKEITINLNSTLGHRFTVASDSSNYCLLDQLSVECYKLG